MRIAFGTSGVSRFIFVALLLAFNWPVLSIPEPNSLYGWLFAAWGLAIAALCLVAHGADNDEDGAAPDVEPKAEGETGKASGPEQQGLAPGTGDGDV